MGCEKCVKWVELKRSMHEYTHNVVRSWLLSICMENNWKIVAAASQAGIDRGNFHRLLRTHGIRRQDFYVPPPKRDEDDECSA